MLCECNTSSQTIDEFVYLGFIAAAGKSYTRNRSNSYKKSRTIIRERALYPTSSLAPSQIRTMKQQPLPASNILLRFFPLLTTPHVTTPQWQVFCLQTLEIKRIVNLRIIAAIKWFCNTAWPHFALKLLTFGSDGFFVYLYRAQPLEGGSFVYQYCKF